VQYKNSQIIMGGLIRSYTYDGFNRRVKTNSNEFSAYSQEGQLLFRQEGSIATQYMYLGSRLVAKKKSQTVSYLHTDILGSVIAETNGSKTVQSRSHYKAFGDTVAAPQDDVDYTSHKFDADLGLSYMQARYYDPVIGRFYSNDPVVFMGHVERGNTIHGFNRYMYANNNPYKYSDPDGEFPVLQIVGAAIGGYTAYKAATSIGGASNTAVFLSVVVGGGIGFATGGTASGAITAAAAKITSKLAPTALRSTATLLEGGATGGLTAGASQLTTEMITRSPTEGTIDRMASAMGDGVIAGFGGATPAALGVNTIKSALGATIVSELAVELENEINEL
jgi:RHS repeat-associated protein